MVFFSALLKQDHIVFANDLETRLQRAGVSLQYMNETRDIWLRDFMPIQLAPGEFAQFTLTKDYYPKKDIHKWTAPGQICQLLGINPEPILYKREPVYLDGGNVIRGFGKAIITEKVFKDNKIKRDILEYFLTEVLKVDQVIFIPVEPGDETGHADGMVRWVDAHTVVANDYSKIAVSRKFRDRLYGILSGSGLNVMPVPYNPSKERFNGYQSASGCYINFLHVGDKIFLPTFDDPGRDEEAILRFTEIFGTGNIIPVPSKEISRGGGVLNCLSWEILN